MHLNHPLALTLLSTLVTPTCASRRILKRADAASTPQPYSVPASQYWDGDDGRWSTFNFQVGSPYQQVRLLPATSRATVAPVLTTGCNDADSNTCSADRGGLYNYNGSSTWSQIGTYQYTTPYSQEALLGDITQAIDGTENVQLSWPGENGLTLSQQLVTGLVDKGIFYLGNFGLSARVSNISTLTNSYESPIGALVKAKSIPSNTYGYTAGFHNTDPPAFGSLTLGGYDTSRFQNSSGLSFPFGPDTSRDLLIGIQRITSDVASSSLLPNPIFAFIDSTVSTIYLPTEACKAFERAFGLVYSEDGNFYPLTTSQHNKLSSLNPSVTFSLGATLAGGQTVQITLPYAAFDQAMNPPLGTPNLKYFPLQRADNSTQYVLGRTFLQHAYLIADYDRQNFSISQALFPQGSAASPQLKAIQQPGYVPPDDSKSLSGGAIAGIVIGVVAVLAILGAIAAFFLLKRRKAKKAAATARKASEDGSASDTYPVDQKTSELVGDVERRPELVGDVERRPELGGRATNANNELDSKPGDYRTGKSELLGSQALRPELEGGNARQEMDAADDGKKYDYMSPDGRQKEKDLPLLPSKGKPIYEMP